MQHVDDGTLQAWLDADRAGLSAAEREDIGHHLAACAACALRAEEAVSLERRARSLLAPPDAGEAAIPPFEAVVARARRPAIASRGGDGRVRVRVFAAWAATLVLALGLGWWASEASRGVRSARSLATSAAAPSPGSPLPSAAGPTVTGEPTTVREAPVRIARAPAYSPGNARETGRAAGGAAGPEPPTASTANGEAPPDQAEARLAESAAAAPPPATPDTNAFADPRPLDVLRGRVTDEAGRPLASASVLLKGTRTGTLTNADGTFSLPVGAAPLDSAAREVTVTATLLGYSDVSRSLAVRPGINAVPELRLIPRAVALEGIVAVGYGSKSTRLAAGPAAVWVPATRPDAERRAGFPLLTVPDLPVTRIEVLDTAARPRVRITQPLVGGGVLELVESREPVDLEKPSAGPGVRSVSTQRGDVYVHATALVDDDTLASLLGRLR